MKRYVSLFLVALILAGSLSFGFASPASAAEYYVSGTWYFNETVDTTSYFYENVTYTIDGTPYFLLSVDNGSPLFGIAMYTETRTNFYSQGSWFNSDYRTIDFGSESQEVSAVFYEWLLLNATPFFTPTSGWYRVRENLPSYNNSDFFIHAFVPVNCFYSFLSGEYLLSFPSDLVPDHSFVLLTGPSNDDGLYCNILNFPIDELFLLPPGSIVYFEFVPDYSSDQLFAFLSLFEPVDAPGADIPEGGFYDSIYVLLTDAFYGGQDLSGPQELVATSLTTFAILFCFVIPFIACGFVTVGLLFLCIPRRW